jgi:hypothetical protein
MLSIASGFNPMSKTNFSIGFSLKILLETGAKARKPDSL